MFHIKSRNLINKIGRPWDILKVIGIIKRGLISISGTRKITTVNLSHPDEN
jgi:hypothetical protein